MAFYYVDRIYGIEGGRLIRGLKNVTRSENFFYQLPDGTRFLNPFIVSEAVAQLGGWLFMHRTDFTKRAVLIADDHTEYPALAVAGDQIDLEVELVSQDDEVIVLRGLARAGDRVLVNSHSARGYLMDIGEFSDPQLMRGMFEKLYRPGSHGVTRIESSFTPVPVPARAGWQLHQIDQAEVVEPGRHVRVSRSFAADDSFFVGHFPRRPVVPAVILQTLIAEASQWLVRDADSQRLAGTCPSALIPVFCTNARIRKFVEPGDVCTVDIRVAEGDVAQGNRNLAIKAVISTGSARVMLADMGFVRRDFLGDS